ncbi:jg5589 [Pararge aegeria aegeria]|uniref:Jg5589 protein n=1 Tax=Pararge aegeria aegeria TaxID=348720 RepID=A0A8S4S468_9NEOP|nr:jg5589 [Pararge aegeria aegeria]
MWLKLLADTYPAKWLLGRPQHNRSRKTSLYQNLYINVWRDIKLIFDQYAGHISGGVNNVSNRKIAKLLFMLYIFLSKMLTNKLMLLIRYYCLLNY